MITVTKINDFLSMIISKDKIHGIILCLRPMVFK